MANKKDRLIQRAQATARQPKPERMAEAEAKRKGYRVVAISLYTPEADWVDSTSSQEEKTKSGLDVWFSNYLILQEVF